VQQQQQPLQQQTEQQPQQPQSMTPEQFQQWQQGKACVGAAAAEQAAADRLQAIREGRVPLEQLTGKELHQHHPEVFEGY
jgi:hypothetical protein